jgi:His-Xaa-Ser system radical SAM maturase HxsC
MSIPLRARAIPARDIDRPIIARVTTRHEPHPDYCYLTDSATGEGPWGLVLTTAPAPGDIPVASPFFHSLSPADHLAEGDVVAADPNGTIRTLYRRASPHNTILMTERCNSFCLMCSQPPRARDRPGLHAENQRLLDLIDPATGALGITGGEPTLFRQALLELIQKVKDRLPATSLHLLTNGRLFSPGYARDLADIAHPDLMLGIPLYADTDAHHDFVVQAKGAFDQTIAGLHNLARCRVAVELRVVLHRHTYQRLPQLATFICRNLPFVAQVALMGLEPMGFAIANLEDLWSDPHEYQQELTNATRILANAGLNVVLFNHQLCVLPERLRPYATRSISDWKNDYLPQCTACSVRSACGGFFSSSLARRYSAHIRPIPAS